MPVFDNQTIIITGSSDGIGFACAKMFFEQGANIVLLARNEPKLKKAADELIPLSTANQRLEYLAADINHNETPERLISLAQSINGRIDVLVNNVGGGSEKLMLQDIDMDEWNQAMNFNLTSCYKMCQSVLPGMIQNSYGRIVNISSIAGRHKGRLSGPQYSAAKAGLQGFTRHIAWDTAKNGITVNAVAPGFVMTDRALAKWHSRSDQDKQAILDSVPMQRFAMPEEIASAVIYLASPLASYITGITLDVNGGSFMS